MFNIHYHLAAINGHTPAQWRQTHFVYAGLVSGASFCFPEAMPAATLDDVLAYESALTLALRKNNRLHVRCLFAHLCEVEQKVSRQASRIRASLRQYKADSARYGLLTGMWRHVKRMSDMLTDLTNLLRRLQSIHLSAATYLSNYAVDDDFQPGFCQSF